MTEPRWNFETLVRNGWHPHWDSLVGGDSPTSFEFTYYRCEHTIHIIRVTAPTQDEAIAIAVREANAWLMDRPGFQPRSPWLES